MFVNTPFNKEDYILTRKSYLLKGYTAEKFLKNFKVRAERTNSSEADKNSDSRGPILKTS